MGNSNILHPGDIFNRLQEYFKREENTSRMGKLWDPKI